MSGQKRTNLSPRQARFVSALLSSPTIEAAAAAAGISSRTGRRYLRDPNVRRAISAAVDEAMGRATHLAVQAMVNALMTLEEIHTDRKAPVGPRVSAARAVLEIAPKLREALDLADRVSALEQEIGDKRETP